MNCMYAHGCDTPATHRVAHHRGGNGEVVRGPVYCEHHADKAATTLREAWRMDCWLEKAEPELTKRHWGCVSLEEQPSGLFEASVVFNNERIAHVSEDSAMEALGCLAQRLAIRLESIARTATEERFENPEDCARIREVAAKHGVFLSMEKAEDAWRAFSEDRCASWLILPDDDALLWKDLSSHLPKEP